MNLFFGQANLAKRRYTRSRRLAMKQYYDKQSAVTARASRESCLAEERLALKRLEETIVLQNSLQYELGGKRDPHMDTQHALAVARAARATIIAEKELATQHVQEAELYVHLSHDAVESADARLRLADEQLAEVLHIAFPSAPRLLHLPTIPPGQSEPQPHDFDPKTNADPSVTPEAPPFSLPIPDAEGPFPSPPLLTLPLDTDAEPPFARSPHLYSSHSHPASLLLSPPGPSTSPPISSPRLASPNLASPLDSPVFYTPPSHTPLDSPCASPAAPQPNWSESGVHLSDAGSAANVDGLG